MFILIAIGIGILVAASRKRGVQLFIGAMFLAAMLGAMSAVLPATLSLLSSHVALASFACGCATVILFEN